MKQFPFIPVGNISYKTLIPNNNYFFNLGALSEEPQEARNKDFKRYRTDFSRKISRKDTLEDIFNRFMLISDPLFFSYSRNFSCHQRQQKRMKMYTYL